MTMEASVRLFSTSTPLNRHLFTKTTTAAAVTTHFLRIPLKNDVVCRPTSSHSLSHNTPIHSSISPPISPNPIKFLLSLSNSQPNNYSQIAANHFGPIRTEPNDIGFTWNPAPTGAIDGANVAGFGDQKEAVTVVLLGWLGAKTKHLKRYVEWYNSRGINAITFVADVREFLWFDLGRRVEKRISELGDMIASWVSEKEEDVRERCLLFHTFSNTGWFAYGDILDCFQSRQDFMGRLKDVLSIPAEEEYMILRKLKRLISILKENQKFPQVYLYRTDDKVIPSKSVEMFMEEQRKMGRNVISFNFGS